MPTIPTINIGNMTTDLDTQLSGDSQYNEVTSSVGGDYLSAFAYQQYPSLYTDTDVIGRKIKIWANYKDVDVTPWWQNRTVKAGDIVFSNGHYYLAVDAGTTGNMQPAHTEGVTSDGAVKWRYLHSGSAVATVISVTSPTALTARVDSEYLPILDSVVEGGTYRFNDIQWSIIGYKNRYPSQVYLFQNRLGFVINTNGYGSWNCLSCSDDYTNFATEQYGQQLDTSALINVLPDNPDGRINWVISASQLYMGGYEGEFIATSGNAAATPTNFVIKKVNETGGSDVMPIKYKELNLFVGAERDQLYSIGYDYTIDDYKPKEISCFAQHLFESGVKRLCALNNKDQNIYAVQGDGTAVLLKYAGDQKVLSYSRFDRVDPILDLTATRGAGRLMGYLAVGSGDGVVSLERMAINEPTYMFGARDFESETYIDGEQQEMEMPAVPQYAGKEVYIRFGENLTQFLKKTLDEFGNATGVPRSKKFRIGLPMVCELHTNAAFGRKVEGMQQQSISVYLRLYNSGAFSYGASVDFDKYFDYKDWPDRQVYDDKLALYTGDCALNIPLGYAEAANWGDGKYPTTAGVGINIKCETPEEFNLLSIQEIYQ